VQVRSVDGLVLTVEPAPAPQPVPPVAS